MISCHYLIYGNVQGVGYRAFVQRIARKLGLSGWVRNLADGRVEVLLFGESPSKDEFENLLRLGPDFAQVDRVDKVERVDKVDRPGPVIYPESYSEKNFLTLENANEIWSPPK